MNRQNVLNISQIRLKQITSLYSIVILMEYIVRCYVQTILSCIEYHFVSLLKKSSVLKNSDEEALIEYP